MEGLFCHPHHHPMANAASVLCLMISFDCVLQKCFFLNLITWQNFIEINPDALLWGFPLCLFHYNWVVSSSMSSVTFPLDFPTLTFSSQNIELYTLTLYLTQLSLRFPISLPRFPITLHSYMPRNSPDIFELLQFTEQELGSLCPKILPTPQNHNTLDVWNSQTSWRCQFASCLAQLLNWLLQIIDPIKQPGWIHKRCHWEGQCCSILRLH